MRVLSSAIIIGCIGLAACSAPADPIAERVTAVAAGLNAITPKSVSDDATLLSAAADKRVLVLRFRTSEWSKDISDREMTRMLRAMVCSDKSYQKIFDKGAAIRFEIASKLGHKLEPFTVKDCK